MKNIVAILAGGVGSRMGGGLPKQFRALADGRTVLETCVGAFETCPWIDGIVVVAAPCYHSQIQTYAERNGWKKLLFQAQAGAERWESSWNAVREVVSRYGAQAEVNLWMHDCARPFVGQAVLQRVATALEGAEGVTVAIAATDTIYEVEPETAALVAIPPRARLRQAQTPQAFRLGILYESYQSAFAEGPIAATDDCGIVQRFSPRKVEIKVVEGDVANRKITFLQDLE